MYVYIELIKIIEIPLVDLCTPWTQFQKIIKTWQQTS